MITKQFTTLARVAIIEKDDGYFIKKKSDEILDIRFNTAMEAIDYARANGVWSPLRPGKAA